MEDFEIGPPRVSASRSRRRRKGEEYMEGVRRGVLGGAYVEELQRSCLNFEEGMDAAAVEIPGGRNWDSLSTSRAAFMVSKAADAAVLEDLEDIRPSMYDWNPLNLDRFLEMLDNWQMTVTEDMDLATAEKYVFNRFR